MIYFVFAPIFLSLFGCLVWVIRLKIKYHLEDKRLAKQERADLEKVQADERYDQALADLMEARDNLIKAHDDLQSAIEEEKRKMNSNNHDPNLN